MPTDLGADTWREMTATTWERYDARGDVDARVIEHPNGLFESTVRGLSTWHGGALHEKREAAQASADDQRAKADS